MNVTSLKAATQRAMVCAALRVLKHVTFGTVEEYEEASAVTHSLSRANPKLFCIREQKIRSIKNP
jgi:hypothetical protein